MKKILKNVSWNILSYVIPVIIAFPVLGFISRSFTVEIFGVFTLMFTIFGYAGIFDLGFSRALVKEIAINREEPKVVKEYLYTASITLGLFSLFPTTLILIFSNNITEFLNVSRTTYDSVINAINVISLAFPILIITMLWQAYLEGLERFKELAFIKLISSVSLSLFPLAFIIINSQLEYLVWGLVSARLLSFALIYFYVYREVNNIECSLFSTKRLKRLYQYGSWLTLTNMITPILSSFDRFLLSSLYGASNLAFYNGPSELVCRFAILPGMVSKVLFPMFARKSKSLNNIAIGYMMFFIMVLIVSPLFIFSEQILVIWLGDEYRVASLTLKILVVGLLFNGLAQLPYTRIQAQGYSKVAAIVHCCEVIPYCALLYILVEQYSYLGAAIAWSVRVFVDCIVFLILSKKLSE